MDTYNLYIGANNDTGELELEKLRSILDKHYKGYTIVHAVGAWCGQREPSVIVTVKSDVFTLKKIMNEIKTVLVQETVGVQEVNELEFY